MAATAAPAIDRCRKWMHATCRVGHGVLFAVVEGRRSRREKGKFVLRTGSRNSAGAENLMGIEVTRVRWTSSEPCRSLPKSAFERGSSLLVRPVIIAIGHFRYQNYRQSIPIGVGRERHAIQGSCMNDASKRVLLDFD